MGHSLTTTYVIVWLVCALGSTVRFFRRSVPFRQKWIPRVALFNVLVIGGFLLALAIRDEEPFAQLILGSAAIAFLVFLVVTRISVCPACGTVARPDNLLSRPKYCTRRGARLDIPNITSSPGP